MKKKLKWNGFSLNNKLVLFIELNGKYLTACSNSHALLQEGRQADWVSNPLQCPWPLFNCAVNEGFARYRITVHCTQFIIILMCGLTWQEGHQNTWGWGSICYTCMYYWGYIYQVLCRLTGICWVLLWVVGVAAPEEKDGKWNSGLRDSTRYKVEVCHPQVRTCTMFPFTRLKRSWARISAILFSNFGVVCSWCGCAHTHWEVKSPADAGQTISPMGSALKGWVCNLISRPTPFLEPHQFYSRETVLPV